MTIDAITSRQILDSRGRPTLETTVHVATGVSGTAAVPAGASTGSHEAQELRDHDPEQYQGAGVLKAIDQITGPIARALKGRDVRDQRAIDQIMIDLDATVNKSALGANTILSVSLAVMRANAALQKQPLYRAIQHTFDFPPPAADRLPRPLMNIINGGKHADTHVKIQEFLIVPDGPSVATRIERGVHVYHQLAVLLKTQHLSTLLGDEGGFAPDLKADELALGLLLEACTAAGYEVPKEMGLAVDFAATEFYDSASQRYQFGPTAGGLSAVGMIGLIGEWLKKYPLLSLEDPLAEDDWDGWAQLTKKIGKKTMIVGDDLLVTNRSRLERAIASGAANALIIKPNQIGTLTETIETIQAAQTAKYAVIVSHRSGETVDSFISDLAVAVGAPWLKAGAPARGERVAKYNRLLQIEQELLA